MRNREWCHVKIHWRHHRESHWSLKSHVHLRSLHLIPHSSTLLILLEASSRIPLEVLLLLIIETLVMSSPSACIVRLNLLCNFWANHLQERHEDTFKLTFVHLFHIFKVRDHHLIRWNGSTPSHTHQSCHQWVLRRGC